MYSDNSAMSKQVGVPPYLGNPRRRLFYGKRLLGYSQSYFGIAATVRILLSIPGCIALKGDQPVWLKGTAYTVGFQLLLQIIDVYLLFPLQEFRYSMGRVGGVVRGVMTLFLSQNCISTPVWLLFSYFFVLYM